MFNVRNVIVLGDFNDESKIHLGTGFRELKHSQLFHRHNEKARKTYIDRVFTNFFDCGLLDVLDPMENRGVSASGEKLGHKAYLLYLGVPPHRAKSRKQKRVNMKKLRKAIRANLPSFSQTIAENIQNDTSTKEEKIEIVNEMASEFTQKLVEITEIATEERTFKPDTADQIIFREIERAEEDLKSGKKPEKTFFKLGQNCTKGIMEKDDTKPHIDGLAKKHNKKLADIKKAAIERGRLAINKIYGKRQKLTAKWANNIRDFRRAVMSTSNSKAKDCCGLSLVVTKAFLSNNTFLRRYKLICDWSLKLGYFPKLWREDFIHFIYKNKGDRSDPGNFRPITIAPSLGKHLERVFCIMIAHFDDCNYDNHAYKAHRSCLTAVIDLQRKLNQAKDRLNRGKYGKFRAYSFLSVDDIKGAFESVSHILVSEAIGLVFEIEDRADLPSFLCSYLRRNSKIVDHDTGEFRAVIYIILDQTTPQGSLISPSLWRIFDAIFTCVYKENLELLVLVNSDVIMVTHTSYADDHITAITFIVPLTVSDAEVGRRMPELLHKVRQLLNDSTSQIGCGINPLKSENLVPERFVLY